MHAQNLGPRWGERILKAFSQTMQIMRFTDCCKLQHVRGGGLLITNVHLNARLQQLIQRSLH